MNIDEKRLSVEEFCRYQPCETCPLLKRKWTVAYTMGCLNIGESPEEDLDRALEVIEEVENV